MDRNTPRWFLHCSHISLRDHNSVRANRTFASVFIYFVLISKTSIGSNRSIFIVRMEQLEQWYYQLIKNVISPGRRKENAKRTRRKRWILDGSREINHPRLNWNLIKGSPLLCRAVAKLVLTSRLESSAWKISCENSSRNTVPSDADSRAATFLIRHAGKIYFQSPAMEGHDVVDDGVRVVPTVEDAVWCRWWWSWRIKGERRMTN